MTTPGAPALSRRASGWLVFVTSGAVLMLEILSLRLVAPYLGLTLETNTAVIGFALGAIALGAWLGGRVADMRPPHRLIGPTVLLSGVLVLFVAPAVRFTGAQVRGGSAGAVLLMVAATVFAPAALLSAVSPMVVKLQLSTLEETGRTVGSFSGFGTLGALVATFATGFLLVAKLPTPAILLSLGGLLIVAGVFLSIKLRGSQSVAQLLVLALLGAVATLVARAPCDVETAYHCALVVKDPASPTGRTLMLDTLMHSYVDLSDPTYLEFSYIRGLSSAVDAMLPAGPIEALHIGGGGVTYPRYLAATRPGSRSLVLEIDRGVIDLDQAKLGLKLGPAVAVKIQDARVGLSQQPAGSRDLVVGDAFGGLAVPWHLTTRETVAGIHRVLKPGGVYAVNVIDYPPLAFARAELATIGDVFQHVALIARPDILAKTEGGNLVIVASDKPIDADAIAARLADRGPELAVIGSGEELDTFDDGGLILTDDYAPVDQLVTQPFFG